LLGVVSDPDPALGVGMLPPWVPAAGELPGDPPRPAPGCAGEPPLFGDGSVPAVPATASPPDATSPLVFTQGSSISVVPGGHPTSSQPTDDVVAASQSTVTAHGSLYRDIKLVRHIREDPRFDQVPTQSQLWLVCDPSFQNCYAYIGAVASSGTVICVSSSMTR
jgi:hypothetical protein